MEEKIFLKPAVAGLLRKHFVEARIHTDSPIKGAEQRALAQKLAGSLANPQYVIVDPTTMKPSKTFSLSGGWSTWEAKFSKFLKAQI